MEFFEKRGHLAVPSSSLVPDDPSVLLTTAGMQQFKKYYTGELDAKKDFVLPSGNPALGTASAQKSFRTSDIDEVGDERHLTFFEMLGNFSFGGYFKKEAIGWAHEFITKEMGLPISYVTIFQGGDSVPKDEESRKIWKSLGILDSDIREEGMDDVFWGPTGTSGPCGPTTEIYCKNGAGQDIEVWNIVFNEFFCTGSREELLAGKAELKPLPLKGIDTGMGLERLAMCAQRKQDVFETDLFDFVMSGFPNSLPLRTQRLIADHLRGAAFLISDGLRPSNKDAGYILRRLLRRVIAFVEGENIGVPPERILERIAQNYSVFRDYRNLNFSVIKNVFEDEYEKFLRVLQAGRKEFEREADKIKAQGGRVMPPDIVFNLYQSVGVTIDILEDLAAKESVVIDRKTFVKDFERHQKVSRAGLERKFGGHGLLVDTGELKAGDEEELQKATRLHTTTHLLQQALREVLGSSVRQMGSDVTAERTRFDFSFERKLTDEEKREVEEIINKKIREDLPVGFKELSKEDAETTGALHFFKQKYPERVKVYYIGRTLEDAYSKEFCGGPHVGHTGEIGGVKVQKEEAVSAGVRRIRVILK